MYGLIQGPSTLGLGQLAWLPPHVGGLGDDVSAKCFTPRSEILLKTKPQSNRFNKKQSNKKLKDFLWKATVCTQGSLQLIIKGQG